MLLSAVSAGTGAPPAPYDYGYGTPAQAAYNTAKTYYQQPPTAAPAYSTTETHYQRKFWRLATLPFKFPYA